MSDTEKRCDVLDKFLNRPDVFSAMADRIVELEAAVERVRELEAIVERVRALHVAKQAFYPNWDGRVICETCNRLFPCPTLRALEETP